MNHQRQDHIDKQESSFSSVADHNELNRHEDTGTGASGVGENAAPRAAMSSTSSVTDSLQGQDTDVDRDHDAITEGISEDGGYNDSDSSNSDEGNSAHDTTSQEGEFGDLSAMPVHSLTAINNSELGGDGSVIDVPRGNFNIPDDQRSVASSVWSTEACTSVKSLRFQRDKKEDLTQQQGSSSQNHTVRQRNPATTNSQDGSVEDEQRMQQQKHSGPSAADLDGSMDAIALLNLSSSSSAAEMSRAGTSIIRLRFNGDIEDPAGSSVYGRRSNDTDNLRPESVTSEGSSVAMSVQSSSSSKPQHMEQLESYSEKIKDGLDSLRDDVDSLRDDADVDSVGGRSSASHGNKDAVGNAGRIAHDGDAGELENGDQAERDIEQGEDDIEQALDDVEDQAEDDIDQVETADDDEGQEDDDEDQADDALQARINAMLMDSDSDDDSDDSEDRSPNNLRVCASIAFVSL
jgi:hypothetical protein